LIVDYENTNPIQDESQDVLHRSKRAQELVGYIRIKFKEFENAKKDPKNRSSTSHNVAIIGTWGEGKTSFINLLKKQLEEPETKNWFHKYLNKTRKPFKIDKGIEIKEFDPWYFPDKCDIHEQFLSLVDNRKNYLIWWWLGCYVLSIILSSSGSLDYYFEQGFSNETIQLILNFINKAIEYLRITYLLPIAIIVYYSIRHPHNIKNLISKIKSIFSLTSAFDFINLFEEDKFDPVKTKKQLKKLTDGRKLLIIIDNIDRLYPFQIKRIFDLVKGIGDLPNIIYILAFDKQIVSKALNKEDIEEGSKYLDKFIQYPIFLHTAYEEHVINTITEVFPNQESIKYYATLLSPYITNIRELKILINTLKQNYKSLQDDVIFHQLLFITAIGVQNYEIYYLISKAKEILCPQEQDDKFFGKLKKLREGINNLNPSPALYTIISYLFPIIEAKENENWLSVPPRMYHIQHYDYFDIYFRISFPDDLVSEKDFKSLMAIANDKDKLSKSLLKLLRPTTEEEKTPNRIHYTFKRLDNLTYRILEDNNFDNIPNWLLCLAKVTEYYADDVENEQNKRQEVACFHSFLNKVAQLLEKEDPAKDDNISPIYAFLRIYLKETDPERTGNQISADRIAKLKDVVINNIKKYSENNNISQLSFFTKIIRFANFNHQEHEVIVKIIKETIKLDGALLKLIKFSIGGSNPDYYIKNYFYYYISCNEALTRLELLESDEHDIKFYIKLLSQQSTPSN
jgi:hypothetical protein